MEFDSENTDWRDSDIGAVESTAESDTEKMLDHTGQNMERKRRVKIGTA